MPKIAVLISGQMRTLDRTHQSIRSCFPDADFFVHAVQDSDTDKAFLLKPRALCIEPQKEMPERKEYGWQLGRGCPSVQGILKQLWGIRRVWQLYDSHGERYDWIVRCRADLLFSVPPESFDAMPLRVHLPKFCNFFGYNDRFAFGPPELMERYFTREILLDRYIDEGNVFHPESFLGWTLREVPVSRTGAVFSALRANGTLSRPVYSKEWGDIIENESSAMNDVIA